MIDLLRQHPDELEALVSSAAEHLKLEPAFVEKDFWVTEVLRCTVQPRTIVDKDGQVGEVRVIFKGGTSLSKGFDLIKRFSEDVDILVVFPEDCSVGAKDNALKKICADVREHLGLGEEQTRNEGSSKGVKRHMRYTPFTTYDARDITKGVLLEMGVRGGKLPVKTVTIQSIVSKFAREALNADSSDWAEFAPVQVEVLGPERTLLEKMSAMHDAATRYVDSGNETILGKGGRHYYDIHCLAQSHEVRQSLADLGVAGVRELVTDIMNHSEAAGFSSTAAPAQGLATSIAFSADSPAMECIRSSYATAGGLIYEDSIPTIEQCLESARSLQTLV
ncbi:nucleotidyl transferase AbiEii/AbiGii toxin family protein [Glutamicibacter sp. NPDC087344]|uniref:nucleotidyl transferase AbiEii/AbiGii toxin family protein n=1 Tax=Glutamicibacter sp. NPDC087344 TaxID=3363994 RepID=UPI0037F89B7B